MAAGLRRLRGPLALLAVSTALALAAGEVVVRWRGVDPHPAAKYRFHSRYGWTMDPAEWRIHQLQPPGFRTPAPTGPSPSPRLLVLGDSFTVAVERQWDETFAGILERQVTARGGSLLSLASGGWGTAQEYLALLNEGLAWQPDAVVLQIFPFNDVCNNGLAMAHTCSWQDHLRPYALPDGDDLRLTWLQPLRGRLRSRSRLVGLYDRFDWWRRMGSPGDSLQEFRRRTTEFTRENARAIGLEHEGTAYSLMPEAAQPEPVRQAWAATEAILEALHSELTARDIPLVAVVIPFSKSFPPEWRQYSRRRPRAMQREHGTARTEAILSRLGVPVVSVRQGIVDAALEPATFFNRRNRHLSTLGHRWTGQWLWEEIAALPDFGDAATAR